MDTKTLLVIGLLIGLAACGKLGVSGHLAQMVGDWALIRLPDGCKAKQIAAEQDSGVAVLCEDGRVFH